MIREACTSDSAAIVAIYNHYICNSLATFEEHEIDSTDMAARIEKTTRAGLPWLVAEVDGGICGYAYAGVWNSRTAYKHTVEVTIYIAESSGSKGFGTLLYEVLFTRLKELNMHCVIAGITLPNPASVAIHEKFGMQKAGQLNEVGFKFGKWLDVGYWTVQLNT